MQIVPQWVFEVLPQIIGAVIILIAGYLVGYGVKKGFGKLFQDISLDDLCSRVNVQQMFEKMGVKSTSAMLSSYAFWSVVIVSVYLAFCLINIAGISENLESLGIILISLVGAVGIMLLGIIIMEVLISILRRIFAAWDLGRILAPIDRALEKTGLKTLDILYITVRIFVILLFLELALLVFRLDFLIPYTTPVLVFIPRVIMAIFVIIAGVAITEFLVRVIFGIIDAVGVTKIIEPLEMMMKSRGIIITILRWIVRVIFILLFIRLSFSIVNLPTEPVNAVISFLPEVLLAMVIIIVSWWIASWLGNVFERFAVERDLPFVDVFSFFIKFAVIYIGIVIGLDELGLETEALYILLAFILGAFAIGAAGVFIFGFRDVGSNLASGMQLKRSSEVGDTIIFEDYSGKIVEITNLSTTIETESGRMIIPNSRLKDAIVIKGSE